MVNAPAPSHESTCVSNWRRMISGSHTPSLSLPHKGGGNAARPHVQAPTSIGLPWAPRSRSRSPADSMRHGSLPPCGTLVGEGQGGGVSMQRVWIAMAVLKSARTLAGRRRRLDHVGEPHRDVLATAAAQAFGRPRDLRLHGAVAHAHRLGADQDAVAWGDVAGGDAVRGGVAVPPRVRRAVP